MKLKKYLIRETQFNYDELLRADVNSDGEVNSTDYAYLKRYFDLYWHNRMFGLLFGLVCKQQKSLSQSIYDWFVNSYFIVYKVFNTAIMSQRIWMKI